MLFIHLLNLTKELCLIGDEKNEKKICLFNFLFVLSSFHLRLNIILVSNLINELIT